MKRSSGLKATLGALFKREYVDIEALKNISFEIQKGEIVGYIGPNGAGKSTTIKIMSGILLPDSGRCEVLGYIPWHNRVRYVKNIGVVFGQRSQLFWDIPPIDSFELLKDIYKIPTQQYKKNLNELTETLNIGPVLETPVRQLSLGQRIRCELIASLLHNPGILFLDEPTIGLDAVSKIIVRKLIKEINQKNQVTVILTTHDIGDIESLTDRILLIGKGQILFDGNFRELKNKYNSYSILTIFHSGNNINLDIENTNIVSDADGKTVLQVDTKIRSVSSVINQLSKLLEISNITIETRPVEEIVADLYKEYQI